MAIYLEGMGRQYRRPTNQKEITMNATTYTPAEALQVVTAEGSIEIVCGVYLNSRENLLADQAGLPEEDEANKTDFTQAPFWLTTDDGQVLPVYGEDDEDLIDVLSNA